MDTLLADLRNGLRFLRKTPGFTLVALAALALGIGANTAIFSVVNAVLLRPLPYPEPDRLMAVVRKYRQGNSWSTSIPKYVMWKQSPVLERMAAYDFAAQGFSLSGGDVPEQVMGVRVSLDYFALFGATAGLGRTFVEEEDRPGGPRVAVVSEGLWRRRFGGDPGMVGKTITLAGEPHTVVGVLSGAFRPDPAADLWLPLQADPATTNHAHYLLVAARLKPGITLEAANAQLGAVGEQFRRQHGDRWMNSQESVAAVPLQERVVGNVRPALLILAGAVSFVLLIACANVANLLLARAAGRQREIAVRAAIGAGRGRLVRQLLTESLLLSLAGGALGVIWGSWGVRLLLAASPGNLPRIGDLSSAAAFALLDWRVLGFSLGVALLTGVLFGVAPAWQLSRLDLSATLKEAGGRAGVGLRQNRARAALVVGETALALVLLIGAALLIRTFVGLRQVYPGFDARHVLTLQTSLTGPRYQTTAAVNNFNRQAAERLEALPGVLAAAPAVCLPVQNYGIDLPFHIEGRAPSGKSPYHGDEFWRYVGPHYFSALKIPLLRGRVFDQRDAGPATPVVLINEAMAKKYWPKEDPIGARITIARGLGPEFEDPPRLIIGVVGDVREEGLSRPAAGVMYVPGAQLSDALTRFGNKLIPVSWVIRTAGDPIGLAAAVRREMQAVDGQLSVANVRTMERVVREATARENFNMLLLGIFAGIALLLAAIGIYGLMSYTVEQRSHEIGVRMALGAERGDVLRLFVMQGLRLTLAGIAVGLGGAYGLTRLLGGLLYGVKATDPLTFGSVAAVLTAVALAAVYVPARRATYVDPIITLRYE